MPPLRLKGSLNDRTRILHALWRQGYSVEGIMQELGLRRGAVERAIQRAHEADARFPARDPATDRSVSFSRV
jgi:IS30 family transposase